MSTLERKDVLPLLERKGVMPILERKGATPSLERDRRPIHQRANPVLIAISLVAIAGLALFGFSVARVRMLARTPMPAEAMPGPDGVMHAPPAPSPFPYASLRLVGPERPPEPYSYDPRNEPEPVRRITRPVAPSAAAPPPVAPVPAPARSAPSRAPRQSSVVAMAANLPSTPPPAAPPHFDASVTVDSTIYSRQNTNVAPPVAILPQTLGVVPAGARRSDYYVIEAIVNDRGDVESARVTDAPLELGDTIVVTMSLSAVKSWQFVPALKDGRPVRYRKLIPVSLR